MNVLFLCTGNACRSILAEAVFNHLVPAGYRTLRACIEAFLALPWEELKQDRARLKEELERIGARSL